MFPCSLQNRSPHSRCATTASMSTARSVVAGTHARSSRRSVRVAGSSLSTATPTRSRSPHRIDDPRFAFRHAQFSELPDVLDALRHRVDRRRAARSRRVVAADSTTRSADFRIATTDRSTCGWIRRAARAQRRSSPAHPLRELTEVIRDYGEERFAQSVARAIAKAREIAADRHDTAARPRRCASRRRAHAG